jgi:hypothetical protein
MKVTYKHLTTLGLASTLLVACSDAPQTEPAAGADAEHADAHDHGHGHGHAKAGAKADPKAAHGDAHGGGEEGDHHEMEALPVEKRVAFMSGHVEAGLALYRAGAPDQAAQHLMHPVSETHASERAGIDALGFDAPIFETVSKALEAGKPASELEPQLKKAEENTALMQQKAGGSTKDIIEYLMGTVVDEYGVGVKAGKITDPGEYQDAFGFSVVALKMAKRIKDPKAAGLVTELEALVATWPKGGPLADSTPTPVAEVNAQTAKVVKALAALP